VLDAARDVLLERGTDARLDEIARRAGVGIATLYRRFPERRHLMREVAIEVLDEAIALAEAARTNEADPYAALARYLRGAVAARVGAVMPLLSDETVMDNTAVVEARDGLAARVAALIAEAQRDGSLRADVTGNDIGLLLIRVCAPLPSPVSRRVEPGVAERHLQIVLDGLHVGNQRAMVQPTRYADPSTNGPMSHGGNGPMSHGNGPVAREGFNGAGPGSRFGLG
jgi:AcrR family transcriptional regulator